MLAGNVGDGEYYANIQPASGGSNDGDGEMSDNTIEAAYARCQQLAAQAIPCSMEVVVPIDN
jgi:hypothetical protein